MKSLYDVLVQSVEQSGNDVDASPRKTYETILRSKQFAIFKPSTKDRLDVGIILKGMAETHRLSTGKQFSDIMTHCVAIQTKFDIDSELLNWPKDAYNNA